MPPGMGSGLAWLSYVSFKGAINSKSQLGRAVAEKEYNVINPKAPGDVLPRLWKHPVSVWG